MLGASLLLEVGQGLSRPELKRMRRRKF